MSEKTLRDEFAKAAITGIMTARYAKYISEGAADSFAVDAYVVADAMLRARVENDAGK